MAHVLVHQRIEEFGRWKEVFERLAPARAAASCRSTALFRNMQDPHEVVVLFEFDDLARARETHGQRGAARRVAGRRGHRSRNPHDPRGRAARRWCAMSDVVVVGAGPTGLLVPGDLAAAGVRVTVLERRLHEVEPDPGVRGARPHARAAGRSRSR